MTQGRSSGGRARQAAASTAPASAMMIRACLGRSSRTFCKSVASISKKCRASAATRIDLAHGVDFGFAGVMATALKGARNDQAALYCCPDLGRGNIGPGNDARAHFSTGWHDRESRLGMRPGEDSDWWRLCRENDHSTRAPMLAMACRCLRSLLLNESLNSLATAPRPARLHPSAVGNPIALGSDSSSAP